MKRTALATIVMCLALISQGKDTTKPWTFWYWMYGAVSEQGVKADLQAMKDVGLGGCYLMPIRGVMERPEYEGNADALSDNFWKMVDLALVQADSLGLGMGIHVCDGFALAGGPWIKPEESMQKIVFCDTIMGEASIISECPSLNTMRITMRTSLYMRYLSSKTDLAVPRSPIPQR